MSNALVTVGGLTDEQLMALSGQGKAARPSLPRIKINREAEDEHGNAIPVGTFEISQGEDKAVFSKTTIFRPFHNTYQYAIYDATAKKTTNRSIHIKDWREEAIDELGTLRCGKIPNKKTGELTPAELEKNKKVKCYRFVYGTVTTVNGVDHKGEKQDVENLPCKFKLSGSNFMPFGAAFDLIGSLGRPLVRAKCALSLTRKKNGATTYYEMSVEPDLKNILEFSQEDQDLWMTFQGMIDRENEYILGKYREALKNKANVPWETQNVVSALSADLNDEIPDLTRKV